jgi:hypothetical protein
MMTRYVKVVLTLIALELLWLLVIGPPRPVEAQGGATPVIITGIRLDPAGRTVLPVSVDGVVSVTPATAFPILTDRPLPVESVPYTPSRTPGD